MMNERPSPPWPPSIEKLEPIEDAALTPKDPRLLQDPVLVCLRQHRQIVEILGDLAVVVDALAGDPTPVGDSSAVEDPIRRRLRLALGEMNRFLAPHRDTEESVLFPYLFVQRPELSDLMDMLGDEHIGIFEEVRLLNEIADRLALEPVLTPAHRAELGAPLRAFTEHVWRHTLTEESMIRAARRGQS